MERASSSIPWPAFSAAAVIETTAAAAKAAQALLDRLPLR
jgi:hypothetical protein